MEEEYYEFHGYDSQIKIDGIPVDPIQRFYFDMTENEERPKQEIEEWWDKPYIVTQGIGHDSFKEYAQRCEGMDNLENENEFSIRRQKMIKKFMIDYPNGFKYIVRCLDGGAWDRSTNHGQYNNLEDALKHAKGL